MSISSSEYLATTQQPNGAYDVTEEHVGSDGKTYYLSKHLAPGTDLNSSLAAGAVTMLAQLADQEAEQVVQ